MRRSIFLMLSLLAMLPALAVVTVSLTPNRPEICTVATGFLYTWTVTGGTPQGVNCLEWETGTSATPSATPFRNSTANTFSAPYGMSVPGSAMSGYIYVRAHARVDGKDFYSAVRTVRVNPYIEITSAPRSYFEPVAPGASVTLGWKVHGATPTVNHVDWVVTPRSSSITRPPFNQRSLDCPTQPSYATLTMPNQETGLVHFQICAVVDGREYRSDERSFDIRLPKVTITGCPTSGQVGLPISASWIVEGWNAGPGNCLVWGASPTALTNTTANVPIQNSCTASFVAPAAAGAVYLQARTEINGRAYESEMKTVKLQPRLELRQPITVLPNTPITVGWTVTGGMPAGVNCLEWGSSATALTNRSQHALTAPYTATLPAITSGALYLRIHAVIDGADYYSPVTTLRVRPTVTVTNCPASVAPGGPIRVAWTMAGGTPTQHYLIWGSNGTHFPNRLDASLTSPAEVTITAPTTPGTVFLRIFAWVGLESNLATESDRSVRVVAPVPRIIECPKNVKIGETFTVAWTVTGGSPEEINNIEWGADDKKFPLKTANATGKVSYQTTLTAPGAGVIYLRAHVVVHGIDYYSPTSAVTVTK